MIYGEDSSEPIDCKLTTAERAYEDSLAVSVLAKKFHPVDEYEAFAKLRDDHGKSEEEIARQYGMTPREVEQVLALGHLSPTVRMAWRQGLITSSAATAFTLADHKRQDEVLQQLCEEERYGTIDDNDVKEILDVGGEAGALVEFVGIDAYVAKGGKVTLDLFGVDHQVSDVKLARRLADEKIADECKALKAAGWGFAIAHPRHNAWNYGNLKAEGKPTAEEQIRLDQADWHHRARSRRRSVPQTRSP
jgi:ParB family chromosome partitioning protein